MPSLSTGVCRLGRSRPCPVIDEANSSHSDIAHTVGEQTNVAAASLGKCENAEEEVLKGSGSDQTSTVVRAEVVAWTHKEKRLLLDLWKKGTKYKECSRQLPGRTVGSCRMQWVKHLKDESTDIWEETPKEERRRNS
ncbi:hypothetical protein N7G274_004733 [Stereocaulon virgatum]|uniref:Myb-like domain-containing protein n=1 Tax=Stereocaulon virgatum TaxID=373712 RepID=A0ABR4A8Z5_9LECA